MNAEVAGRPRALSRAALRLLPGCIGLIALVVCLPPAAADTVITETSTTFLYTLDAANSPYILSHDFSVLPGGTLYIGPGAELQIENGSVLRGQGGGIQVLGTSVAPATVRARPGAASPAWGGFDLGSGSDLSLRFAVIHNGTPAISVQAGASVSIDGVAFDGCGTWCLRVFGEANVSLVNSTFADGSWGYFDEASRGTRASNLSFANFSVASIALASGATDLRFDLVRVASGSAGLLVDGAGTVDFTRVDVAVTVGAALWGSMPADLSVHNSSIWSAGGVAVELDEPVRFRIESSMVTGGAGAIRLVNASAPALVGNRLSSSSGACLDLPGARLGFLEGNQLTGCARSLLLARGVAAPNATAGPTNTVDGKPFLWVDGGSGVAVGFNGSAQPGLIALFRVNGAVIRDVEVSGAGIYLFGCTDVTLERVHISSAEVGVAAVGTRGLNLIAFRADDVGRALDVWSDAAFPQGSADILVERARVERVGDTAFAFDGAANVTFRRVMVDGAAVGLRFNGSDVVLLANLLIRGAAVGVWAANSTDVTLVDSEIEGASTVGLLVDSSWGVASRNAFVDNAVHASAPASPSFAFNELLAGNYWTNWNATDANSDGWADYPYNLSDGTGVDYRPRVVRWDFAPTALPAARGTAELGVVVTLDATPSFDDFVVSEVYWEILGPADDVNGEGPTFAWTPNGTGVHLIRVSVVGSLGATDDYQFPVIVVDTRPPSFTFAPLGRPEAGANLTVVLIATDNDPAFQVHAYLEWVLSASTGPALSGNATGVTFEVRIMQARLYTLTVTLFDASGNWRNGSVEVDVGDTTPPQVEIAFDGEPDLGLPFVLDAAATFDPSGLDVGSVRWSWVEGGTSHELTTFPVAEVTFEDPGNYTVTLHICDQLGNCAEERVQLVTVDSRGPRLIKIHIVAPQRDPVDLTPGQATVVNVRAGDEVVFEILAEDPSGAVTFLWDFGDGATAEGARVIHRFAAEGDVTVLVTMRDPLGNTNPAAVRMEVEPGGGLFGEIIPGVSTLLLVLVVAGGAVAGAAFVLMRRRKRPPEAEPAAP